MRARPAMHPGQTAGSETHAKSSNDPDRCPPARSPKTAAVRESFTRHAINRSESAGDPSRLNRAAHRCVSVGILNAAWVLPRGIPPSRALSAGRLAPTGRTGRPRRSRGFHHRLLRGTRREGSHPDGWGLRRRGPAGRCADPHRENWPEVGVPVPARHPLCWGPGATAFTATGPPGFHHRRLTALHRGTAGLRPASPPEGRRERVTSTALAAPGSALHSAIYRRKAVRPLTRRSRSSRSCEVS